MSPPEVLAMGMDIVPQLTPPLSQCFHVRGGDQAEQSCSEVPSPVIFFFFTKYAKKHKSWLLYVPMHTPLLAESFILFQPTHCTDSVSICEGADHCMGNSVTWGAHVSSAACEQPLSSLLFPTPPFHPLHHFTLNMALYFSLVIFRFHCLSQAVTSWRQTNLCLLYISSESPGEPCLYCLRQGRLGRQPGENLSSFFTVYILDLVRYMHCQSLGGRQHKQGLPQCAFVCVCVIVGWGMGEWFVVMWARASWHIIIWLYSLSHGERKVDVSTQIVLLWKNITDA